MSKSQRKKQPKQLTKKPKTIEEAKKMAIEKYGPYVSCGDGYSWYLAGKSDAIKEAIAKFKQAEEKRSRR